MSALQKMTRPARYWFILKTAVVDFVNDGALRLGAALSFYTVLSLSPLVLVIVLAAGMIGARQAIREQLVREMRSYVGQAGAEVTEAVLRSADRPEQGFIALVFGLITLIFGATGAFAQLQDALNIIWDVHVRPGRSVVSIVRTRLLSLVMVLVIGLLLLASLGISAALTVAREYFTHHVGELGRVWQGVDILASTVVMSALFAIMFKVLPDAKIAWRDVTVGAILTGVLMTVGKFVLGLYLGYSSVGSPYGAAGSLIVLLVWVYYSSLILFFGAELTQVYAHLRGARPAPKRHALRTAQRHGADQARKS